MPLFLGDSLSLLTDLRLLLHTLKKRNRSEGASCNSWRQLLATSAQPSSSPCRPTKSSNEERSYNLQASCCGRSACQKVGQGRSERRPKNGILCICVSFLRRGKPFFLKHFLHIQPATSTNSGIILYNIKLVCFRWQTRGSIYTKWINEGEKQPSERVKKGKERECCTTST